MRRWKSRPRRAPTWRACYQSSHLCILKDPREVAPILHPNPATGDAIGLTRVSDGLQNRLQRRAKVRQIGPLLISPAWLRLAKSTAYGDGFAPRQYCFRPLKRHGCQLKVAKGSGGPICSGRCSGCSHPYRPHEKRLIFLRASAPASFQWEARRSVNPAVNPTSCECSGQNAVYLVFCSAAVSSCRSSAFCQVELGLYSFIALARTSVFLPRSFSYTTPSWLTRNVITPDDLYSAG